MHNVVRWEWESLFNATRTWVCGMRKKRAERQANRIIQWLTNCLPLLKGNVKESKRAVEKMVKEKPLKTLILKTQIFFSLFLSMCWLLRHEQMVVSHISRSLLPIKLEIFTHQIVGTYFLSDSATKTNEWVNAKKKKTDREMKAFLQSFYSDVVYCVCVCVHSLCMSTLKWFLSISVLFTACK